MHGLAGKTVHAERKMLAIPSQFLTQLGMMRLDASKACVKLVDVPLVLIGAFGLARAGHSGCACERAYVTWW